MPGTRTAAILAVPDLMREECFQNGTPIVWIMLAQNFFNVPGVRQRGNQAGACNVAGRQGNGLAGVRRFVKSHAVFVDTRVLDDSWKDVPKVKAAH